MKAYLVSDIRDSSNEVVIAVTENSIKARSLAKTKYFKYSATSFVENQYIFRYNHFVSVEEVLCLLKVDNLKIMNSIDYAKIKQIGEVEIGEEYFVFDGVGRKLGGTIGFYVFLLTNYFLHEKIVFYNKRFIKFLL